MPAKRYGGTTTRTPEQLDSRSISVVAADNHPLFLRGIACIIQAEPDIRIAGEATDGNDALHVIREISPDVALLSLRMSGKGALEVLEELRGHQSKTRFVILAARMSEEEFLQAMRLGVRGIVLKSMPPELLVRCVRMVHAGEEFIEKNTFLRAFAKLLRNDSVQQEISSVLTARERDVVDLAVSGMTNKDVARKLAIAEGTVKAHLHRAYTKLGVPGRVGLFLYAREHGLV